MVVSGSSNRFLLRCFNELVMAANIGQVADRNVAMERGYQPAASDPGSIAHAHTLFDIFFERTSGRIGCGGTVGFRIFRLTGHLQTLGWGAIPQYNRNWTL